MNSKELVKKWSYKIIDGWYGFDVEGISDDWSNDIDVFLTWLDIVRPQFGIRQIKVKFGGLRVYVDIKTEEPIDDSLVKEIQQKLDNFYFYFDKNLYY